MHIFEVEQPSVAISGTDARFPVRRIFCIGRNYADHAREMGHDPDRTPPVFFTKPADAVVENGAIISYPGQTENLHHEVEMVVALEQGGADLSPDDAEGLIFGYAVGIDLTRRDLQKKAKDSGTPWDAAKGFDQSAPISPIHLVTDVGHRNSGQIWLKVNGENRQNGDLNELIWTVPECIAELSRYFRLEPGDLVFTGTPAGVGPVVAGDHISAGIEDLDEITITIKR